MTTGSPVLASRRLLWVLTALVYLHVTAAGAAVLLFPHPRYVGTAAVLTLVWGVTFTLAGGAATLGVLARRRFGYVLEWSACYVIAVGLLLYTWLSWETVLEGIGNLPRALIVAAGVLAALARGTYLALEDYTARQIVLATARGDPDD